MDWTCCLQMYPYRESLSRLCFGQELSGAPFYLLTYASLAVVYLTAMASSSIWVPLQLVGATAGTLAHKYIYISRFGGGHALDPRRMRTATLQAR